MKKIRRQDKFLLIFLLYALFAYSVIVAGQPNTEEVLNNTVTYYDTGNVFYESQQYEAAINKYNKAIEQNPNYTEAYLGRGLAYRALGNYTDAIDDFNKTVELDLNLTEAYYNRGKAYYILKQYEKALQDYNNAIELNPYLAEAYTGRGITYYDSGHYEEAIADFNTTLQLNANNSLAFYGRGLVYIEWKQYENAIADFNKTIDLNPSSVEGFYGRGLAYLESQRYEKAINDFNSAIETNPDFYRVYFVRGLAYYSSGQYENAIADFDKVIDSGSEGVAHAYCARGKTYSDLRQYENAIADFNNSIALNPDFADAYYGRGLVYMNLNQYEKAIADFNRVTDLDPDFAEAYYNREMVKERVRKSVRVDINPVIGVILAVIPVIAAMLWYIWDKRRNKQRHAKLIENWEANLLIIPHIIMGFWSLLLCIIFVPKTTGELNVILNYGAIIALAAFCVITAKVVYNFFIHNEISKNYAYFNIAFAVSCTIFASLLLIDPFDLTSSVSKSIAINTALIAVPLSVPSFMSLYITQRYGEILIIKGKETKIQTTSVFPPELEQFYSDAEYIGGGGFAWVFQAIRNDGTKVAVKIPAIKDEKAGMFFLREVQNWSALEHKNIVRLYGFNIYPVPYLEMELCDSSIGFGIRKVEEAVSIIYEVAKGLNHAHERSIVHADIKHSNILIKAGTIKISDWGLSKVRIGKSLSVSALTPDFAAPEQIFGRIDERTDIWQLGVVFYELVTGKLPFAGEYTDIINCVINDEPVPPSELNPESKCVEHIIMKCLSKRKEDRYTKMEELVEDLKKYVVVCDITELATDGINAKTTAGFQKG